MTSDYRTHRQTERETIGFADTRSSRTKTMRNTSRAPQPHRNDNTNVTRIVAPVAPPRPAKSRPTWSPPSAVAPPPRRRPPRRSHDERLVEQLASRAFTGGKREIHVRRDEDGRIIGAGTGGEDDGECANPGPVSYGTGVEAGDLVPGAA
ncbi:hypothetical protein GCM10010424_62810 [Streptomyces lienomycini]|uniref:hypothetical protein n=1 Tax=Streptomyces lienomycini TaxID=284035 RepID=UPI0031DB6793